MKKTWFTADTHLGHAKIIHHCNRPFENVGEMDEEIIRRWNEVVQPDDDIWHLGDVAFRNKDAFTKYFKRLNGRKHLIWGNHDSHEVRIYGGWASSQPFAEIHVDGHLVVLCHYAMRVWNKAHRGALHLFGHSHNNIPGNSQSLDVGVDCWDYRPVSLTDIKRRMATLPSYRPEDHHATAIEQVSDGAGVSKDVARRALRNAL